MLAGFVSWWIARMAELFPRFLTDAAGRAPDGIVIEADASDDVTARLRRKGREEPLTLGVAARMASRKPVFFHPRSAAVLEKHHVVPTAPRREMAQLLRHELGRITPFPAEALFWHWQGRVRPTDRTRTEVALTMVPKAAVATALDKLAAVGIQPRYLEVGASGQSRLLPIQDLSDAPAARHHLVRALAWTCGGLAVVVLALPFVLQAIALYQTNSAIETLRPSVAQVEALRRGITADGAGQEVLAQEMRRTGDVLQVLAIVTRILPDDTFLTDFSLRNRHLTIGGRSASAPRLITGLSADPAIRNAAFAAPVTRIEGATSDIFSIQGEIVP
jgi:general secretion pathway protein L